MCSKHYELIITKIHLLLKINIGLSFLKKKQLKHKISKVEKQPLWWVKLKHMFFCLIIIKKYSKKQKFSIFRFLNPKYFRFYDRKHFLLKIYSQYETFWKYLRLNFDIYFQFVFVKVAHLSCSVYDNKRSIPPNYLITTVNKKKVLDNIIVIKEDENRFKASKFKTMKHLIKLLVFQTISIFFIFFSSTNHGEWHVCHCVSCLCSI